MTLLVAALLASSPAHALSCQPSYLAEVLPIDDAEGVPVNTVPVLRIAGASPPGSGAWDEVSVTLTDLSTGAVLDAALEVVEADTPTLETWRLVPTHNLPPDRQLSLVVADSDGWINEEIRFSTGSQTDLEAPGAASANHLSYTERSDEWGYWRALHVDLESDRAEDGAWWRIELSEDRDFTDPLVRATLGPSSRFADDPCTADAAALAPNAELWVRVTAVDAAGNEAEPQVSHFDARTASVGCSTAGARTGPLQGLAGLVGLLALARRRT